jgi:A/G-specific adenine glycosylase
MLRWYRQHRRDLPWRRTPVPYRIWISEIMLQQTRVDVVVPYYEAFLQRFPDVDALARAPLDAVLQQWSGLGYYRRARHLHQAARQIVERHGGVFPQRHEDILALPGIGPYTAGAIASIAFDQRRPIVDGNVMRVFARLFSLSERIETAAARQRLWGWAGAWADCRHPGDANQALMELGATLCSRSSPDCGACPVAWHCGARQAGLQAELPRRAARRAAVDVDMVAFLVRRRGRLLLAQRRPGILMPDFWEVPTHVHDATQRRTSGLRTAQQQFEVHSGLRVESWRTLGETRHGILHHRIRVRVLEAVTHRRREPGSASQAAPRRAGRRPSSDDSVSARLQNLPEPTRWRWMTPSQSLQLASTTLTRKVLKIAAGSDSSWQQYTGQRPSQQSTGSGRHEPA